MPCGQECCVKLRAVQDLDLDNIEVYLGQQRRHDFQATSGAPAALRAVVERYTRPEACPGTQACPGNCPCEVFEEQWSVWKEVTVRATYNVPGIGQLTARTTANRRVGKGIGWCEEAEIALSHHFFVPGGAEVALALKEGVSISEEEAERLESLFAFHA